MAERAGARRSFFRFVVAAIVLALTAFFVHNTTVNLAKRGIASGFGFLDGHRRLRYLDLPDPLYAAIDHMARAFFVGLMNTLMVSVIGVILATLIGFVVGVARLSRNFLIAKLAAAYVDIIRNIPLLAQIIFWYFGVLTALPGVRQSLDFLNLKLLFLNTRGLYMPAPILQPGFWIIPAALVVGIAATFILRRWAHRRQELTGQQFPDLLDRACLDHRLAAAGRPASPASA